MRPLYRVFCSTNSDTIRTKLALSFVLLKPYKLICIWGIYKEKNNHVRDWNVIWVFCETDMCSKNKESHAHFRCLISYLVCNLMCEKLQNARWSFNHFYKSAFVEIGRSIEVYPVITDQNAIFPIDPWSFCWVLAPSHQQLQHCIRIHRMLTQAPFLKYFHTLRNWIPFLVEADMLAIVAQSNYAEIQSIELELFIYRYFNSLIRIKNHFGYWYL